MTVAQLGASPPAAWHTAAYVDSPHVNTVVLAEPDAAARDALTKRFGIVRRTADDYRGLLTEPGIDVVDIRVPLAECAATAVAALEAGKHVICTGPPATHAAEFRRMMSAVGEGRLFVLVADLYIPANRKASELLADGELGEPVTADWVATDWPHSPFGGPGAGERSWPNSDAGLLANRGYGALVLLQRWLGPAISVSASATPRAETLSLQTECGALGQLTAVAAVAGDVAVERRLIGSDAALLIRDDPEDEIALGGFVDGLFQPIKVHHTPYVQRHATRLAIQDILECIVGEAEPELSNAEALRAMSVLDAARASIETSRCVEILGD